MAHKDPLQQAIVALMDSLTDATEWEEKRIGLFHTNNDKFVAILPSNTHYGAVRSLCHKFNLTHRMVTVNVIYSPSEDE